MKVIKKIKLTESEVNTEDKVQEIEQAAFDNQGTTTNGIDYIALNVPLFMRLMEYAKEDAKTDMDLHKVTENILGIQQGKNEANQAGSFLTMDDYDNIVDIHETNTSDNSEEKVEEAVQDKRMYSKEAIIERIVKVMGLDEEDHLNIERLLDTYEETLTPEDVDSAMLTFVNKYNIPENYIAMIEQEIAKTPDPKEQQRQEELNDFDSDMYRLKTLADDIVSPGVKKELEDLIQKLDNIKQSDSIQPVENNQ